MLLLRPSCSLMLRDRAASTLLNCVEGSSISSNFSGEDAATDANAAGPSPAEELVGLGAVSALTRSVETLVDGRDISQPSSLGFDRGRIPDARDEGLQKAAEPMVQCLLDVLWHCCSHKPQPSASSHGANTATPSSAERACNELFQCGGVHLMMLLLGDKRVGVQQRACRVLALACSSGGDKAAEIRRLVWSKNGGALTKLVALVKHRKKGTAKAARRCLDGLRNHNIAKTSSSSNNTMANSNNDDEVLLPLIEQGVVPIFHGMSKDAEDLLASEQSMMKPVEAREEGEEKTTKRKRSASTKLVITAGRFAADYLAWLELAIRGQEHTGAGATFRVLLRTLCMQGNEELRGHVATALVILCFKVDSMRQAFVREGALDASLSMLRHGAGRSYALDFLHTLEPLVNAAVKGIAQIEDDSGMNLTNPYAAAAASGMDPPPAELLSERHINNPSSSDIMLRLRVETDEDMYMDDLHAGTPKQTLWTFHAHRSVLQASSEYFRTLFTSGELDKKEFDISVASFEGFEALVRFSYTADESQLWRTVEEQGWSMAGSANANRSASLKNKSRGTLDGKLRAKAFMRTMVQAHRLGMGGVKRLCAKRACTRVGLLGEDTVLFMFLSAMQCEEMRLARVCFAWAIENWMTLLRSWDPLVVERNTDRLVGVVRKFLVRALDKSH
jgi:hypothetical protein